MPFISIPFDDPRIEKLKDLYKIQGIPKLIVVK